VKDVAKMETNFISEEDKKNYVDFFTHLLNGVALRRGLRPIYHYTSGERLIQIISSGEHWATQASCLNDSKELSHSVDLLKKTINKRKNTEVSKEFDYLLSVIEEILNQPDVAVAGVFVSCFSEREDDLSQWRAYGGLSGGYSIEYDTGKLAEIAGPQRDLISPVIYEGRDLIAILDDLIKHTEIYFMQGIQNGHDPMEEWAKVFAEHWLEQLSFMTPLLPLDRTDKFANMTQNQLENCPNCKIGMDTDGLSISITYLVYECTSCRNIFCELCSDALFSEDDTITCPHCSIICFDAKRANHTGNRPSDVVEIEPLAFFTI